MSTFESRKAITTSTATQTMIANHLKKEEQNAQAILAHVTRLVNNFMPDLPGIFAKLADMTEGRISYQDSPWKVVYFDDVKSVERLTYHGHSGPFKVDAMLYADGMAVVSLELSPQWWAKQHYDEQDGDMFARLDAAELMGHKLANLLEEHNERMLRLCLVTPALNSVAVLDEEGIPISDDEWEAMVEKHGYADGSRQSGRGMFGGMGEMFGGMIPLGGGILPRR